MSIAITLTDPHNNKIDYTSNDLLSAYTKSDYISITYNLVDMLEHLPCKWPRNHKEPYLNWENIRLRDLKDRIEKSIYALAKNEAKYTKYNAPNHFGTTQTAFKFLADMLILCTCYPNAICHIE